MKTSSSILLLLIFEAALLTPRSEQTVINRRIGDEVVLEPPAPPASVITRVRWKQNDHLAVEWDGKQTDQFSHFKDRSYLNISTGELTIRDLTEKLSGDYVVWINGYLLSGSLTLKVISPVPKPNIAVSCNEEKTQCTLTCEGNVTAMDPKPTYTWKFNATEQKTPDNIFEITPETSAYEFICELENLVSRESSQPIQDPFTQAEAGGLKINTGLVVFASLLAIVVGVALLHRVKSGMWFYQKDSMPWEADFWKTTEIPASSEPQHANDDTERNTMMESNS